MPTRVQRLAARRRRRRLRAMGIVSLAAAGWMGALLAWQVWGTGLATSRAQAALRAELSLRRDRPTVVWSAPARAATAPRVPEGSPIGVLAIPRLDLGMVVVEGTEPADLAMGPGHYPGSAYPWDAGGRVAVAGHRTTYLRPFWALDELLPGDVIRFDTAAGTFVYRVTATRVVDPTDSAVLRQTRSPTLVLTTCEPRFSATHRLVVFASRTQG